MNQKTILILGGYGGTGKLICRWLLKETEASIIIAGHDIKKAEELCDKLKQEFPTKNIFAIFVDVLNYDSLISAFKNASLVIDATTVINCVQNITKAALEAKVDYLDFHFEQKVFSELKTLSQEIKDSGRCFITQAGFHPGLPSAFVRYVAPQFDELKKAIVGTAMNVEIKKPESVYEIVDILADDKADIFKNSKWRKANYKDSKKIDFGSQFGIRTCYPIQMEEMYALPEMFPLDETGVYVAGFNWFIDYFVIPLTIVLSKIKKGLGRSFIAKLLVFGFKNFSKNNRGVSFVLEAEGIKNEKQIKFRVIAEHEDAYEFTAIPIVACVRQYLDGFIDKPGLWLMGQIINPDRLILDMKNMGIKIKDQID
ncbi:MAG: saccharopine dehydrogenase NADP-binding domain-containing protein [Candidatus Uhrbacteria bacterium]